MGQVPLPEGFLAGLRAVTKERGVVLILDEVITGFRWSRGGAQARFGIIPDLCVLAKIVAGGLPGGAVAGRADIMDQLDRAAAKAAGREKIGHQGTFNSNPLCAAAAVATLSIVEREDVCARAEATAEDIRYGCDKSWSRRTCPGASTATPRRSSFSRIPKGLDIDPQTFDPLRRVQGAQGGARRQPQPSPAHRDAGERRRHHGRAGRSGLGRARAARGAHTLEAFRTSVRWLKAEGDVAHAVFA